MSEYYAVQRSTDHLAHYGVKGMKWGIRRSNPQRDFYKSMKSEMKASRKANRKAKSHVVSGAKNIGRNLPKNMVNNYATSRNQLLKAQSEREKHDKSLDALRQDLVRSGKQLSKKQQNANWNKMRDLSKKEDRAYENYEKQLNRASEKLLGKYSKKKIKLDSHNTNMKRDASWVLRAALESQVTTHPKKKRR